MAAQNGSQWVWGVDVSTRRLAIACDGPDRVFGTVEFPRLVGVPRLAAIAEKTAWLARQLAEHRPPLVVFVEEPTGAHPNPALSYAAGVVQAALYDALLPLQAFPTTVQLVPISTWKKLAVGHGHAKKPQILEWAQANGMSGSDPDAADAWGIARAGRLLLER